MTPPGLEQAFREVAGSTPVPNWAKAFIIFLVHWLVWWKGIRRNRAVVEAKIT